MPGWSKVGRQREINLTKSNIMIPVCHPAAYARSYEWGHHLPILRKLSQQPFDGSMSTWPSLITPPGIGRFAVIEGRCEALKQSKIGHPPCFVAVLASKPVHGNAAIFQTLFPDEAAYSATNWLTQADDGCSAGSSPASSSKSPTSRPSASTERAAEAL